MEWWVFNRNSAVFGARISNGWGERKMKACKNCAFWQVITESVDSELSKGECRKDTPEYTIITHEPYFKSKRIIKLTREDFWCGQWEKGERKI